jgi:hypothetical protein
MAINVLALASGVTGLADHRALNGALLAQNTTGVQSGIIPGLNVGAWSTVSAMVLRISPVKLVINNGVSNALGPYVLVSDANVDITFDAGQASVSRVDRVIARVYDNTNDGSGSTVGSIYYLKGQVSGAATALPTNSILLYEVTVPAGASSGTGGITFSTQISDKRVYTSAAGGIIPAVANNQMIEIQNPYEGMAVYRTDWHALHIYDDGQWNMHEVLIVSASGLLAFVEFPRTGQLAIATDTYKIYVYNGTTWDVCAGNNVNLYNQTTADTTITTTTLSTVLTVTLPRVGTYSYDLMMPFTNTVAVGRHAFALGGTSTPSAWRWNALTAPYNSATGLQAIAASGTSYPAATSGTALVNSDMAISTGFSSTIIKGVVTVTAVGTLTFRFATNGAGNTITPRAGSMVNVKLEAG